MQAAQAAHARRFRPLPTIKDKATGKTVDDPVATRLKQTRSALGMTTTKDDVDYFKKRMAAKAAAKPDTAGQVKSRPGDVVIDLVTGVWTTTVERNIPGPSSPRNAVSKLPNVSAKHTK